MATRNEKLVKNTIILGFGQFLPKLTALVTLPILTAALTTSEYGIYDLILTAQSLLMPLMTLQIQQGIFRKLIQKGTAGAKEIVSSAYFFLLASFAIWCPIIIIFFHFAFKYSFAVTFFIYLFYLLYSLFDVFGQTVRGIGYNAKYSAGIVIYSVVNMILLLILYWMNRISVISVFSISVVAYAIACLYYLVSSKLYEDIKIADANKNTRKELLDYSIPMIPSSIALWVVNLSDRILVTIFLGTSLNGIYSVANRIPNLFASVYTVFNLAWTETAARVMDKDSDADQYYTNMFSVMFKFLSGAMLLLISISPLLFRILINEQFDEAFAQMPVLFMGVFFNCIVSFYGGIYVAKQQTKQVGISSAVGAILNIVINLSMIHNFGLYAASVSTVVSFAIIAVYRGWDIRKYVDLKYNSVEISFCLISMFVYSILCARRSVLINAIMFGVAIIWNLIFNRDMIIKMLTVVKRRK
jgi:O-antigen/teichoic acid export membrane protein